jgi:hypothetical protein
MSTKRTSSQIVNFVMRHRVTVIVGVIVIFYGGYLFGNWLYERVH